MSIKKKIIELEKHMSLKFPEFDGKFYTNRRNFYIHLGLDKSLLSFNNYKMFLQEIDSFLLNISLKTLNLCFLPN